MLNSARRNISYPNPDFSDRANVPAHILNLVNALEIDLIYAQGTVSQRTALPHLVGTFFFETDTKNSYYDDGTVWRFVGGNPAYQGLELDYAQITSPLAPSSVSTEATAITIVSGSALPYDGSKLKIEFFSPGAGTLSASVVVTLVWLRDTTVIGQTKHPQAGLASATPPIYTAIFDQPSASTHTYLVKAFGGAAFTFSAGAGGSGNLVPSWIRVTKV